MLQLFTTPTEYLHCTQDDIFGEEYPANRAFGRSNGVTSGPNGANREGGPTSPPAEGTDYRKTDDFQTVKNLDALDRRTEVRCTAQELHWVS